MNSLITGSHAYGRPRHDSDVDLVILVTPDELEALKAAADDDSTLHGRSTSGHSEYNPDTNASLRFGNLNLIATTDPVDYAIWFKGTQMLKQHRDRDNIVTRELAVATFEALLRKARIRKSTSADDREITVENLAKEISDPIPF